jgi:hypothetical protein
VREAARVATAARTLLEIEARAAATATTSSAAAAKPAAAATAAVVREAA